MSNCPISAIRIGNFKAFGETQTIPIKPITLIFGPNSAGKSSIIQSLAFAHEIEVAQSSAMVPSIDVYRTDIGGKAIDLGGFRQFVHCGEEDRRVEWGCDIDIGSDCTLFESKVKKLSVTAQIWLVRKERHRGMDKINPREMPVGNWGEGDDSADLTSDEAVEKLTERFQGRDEAIGLEREPRVLMIEVSLDGNELVRMSYRGINKELGAAEFRIDRMDTRHPVFQFIDWGKEDFFQAVDESMPHVTVIGGGLCHVEPSCSSTQFKAAVKKRDTATFSAMYEYWSHVSVVLREVDDLVSGQLSALQYLGPLRALPPRNFSLGSHKDADWRSAGGFAWEILIRDDEVRENVNKWLGDRELMDTPYRFEVRTLVPLWDLRGRIAGALSDYAPISRSDEDAADEYRNDLDRMEVENQIESARADDALHQASEVLRGALVSQEIKKTESWAIIDERRKTEVAPQDIGVGISQVIPVLVSAYASRNKLIAMEQPEIHLHPKLQAQLADVIIESALGERGNSFILETHSEHFILRIMRAIREGRVKPEDVAVLYVQPNGSSSTVLEMRLDEEGDLIDSWPGGFFEESYREKFSGR